MTTEPTLAATFKRHDRIGLAIVVAASLLILAFLFGCGGPQLPPGVPTSSTPQQIANAQTAVASIKSDVAAAKVAAASVATAHEKMTTAKATVAALPTEATTMKAEAQAQIDGADADLVSADSALGVTLTNADAHTTAAATALTGAQKSAQTDAKTLHKTQEEVQQLKAADPAKGWFELIGIAAVVLGIAVIVCTIFAESIPVVGPWLTKLGKFAYEAGAALIGGGLLLITLSHYIGTIEKVIGWTIAGVAVIAGICVALRYWPTIQAWIKGGNKSAPAAAVQQIPIPAK